MSATNNSSTKRLEMAACAVLLSSVLALVLTGLALPANGLSGDPSEVGPDAVVESAPAEAIPAEELSGSYSDARENSLYLQRLISRLSYQGGGVVSIPEGTFYFAATGKHELGDYAVEAKSNVKIVGAGQDKTVLKPVGAWAETGLYEHGIDMFAYFGMDEEEFLVNADFEDFTIDGLLARGNPDAYNASGKGFYFKLFRDCDWLRVTVRNTDGTGFGMDFPINCTVTDCIAAGCGKNAEPEDVGASGFGIGTGYSGLESIVISNCQAFDNTKFGFFFEHQTRFANEVEALRGKGYYVVDCVASGNLYNFGGARAHDVVYERCTSQVSSNHLREAYTVRAFCFENHSCRTQVIDCVAEQRYADVLESDACYEAAQWALSESLLESGARDSGEMLFRPHDEMSRAEAVALLWRYAGRPGEVASGYTPVMSEGYSDVFEEDYYVDAALWMSSIGDASLEEFRGSDPITRAEVVTMIWRMAGKPKVDLVPGFVDVDENDYYASALAWSVAQGFIPNGSLMFGPHETCARDEVVMLLKAYDGSLAAGLVGDVCRRIDMLGIQELQDQLGGTVLSRICYLFEHCKTA